jgi:hypothetical protein
VAAFDLDTHTRHPPDFALLRGGGLALFRRTGILAEAEAELEAAGYTVVGLDAALWVEPESGETAMHRDLAEALSFPAYYEQNLAHGGSIGPHYDYRAPDGVDYRVYPDGQVVPK